MNNFELCETICGLSPSVNGAGIIDKAKLVAMYSKPGVPIPNEEKFERLFFQVDVIAGIMKGNVDYFGEVKYFTLHFANADLYFFHLAKYKMQGILALQIAAPFEHDKIVSDVNGLLTSLIS